MSSREIEQGYKRQELDSIRIETHIPILYKEGEVVLFD